MKRRAAFGHPKHLVLAVEATMKTKYRVVADCYNGFECQKKRWWFPFWTQMNLTNSHSSMEAAKAYIENDGKALATYVADS